MEQKIITINENYCLLDEYLKALRIKRLMLVCGGSVRFLRINDYFNTLRERLGIEIVRFSDFQPNPSYDSVIKGVRVFNENQCEAVLAVGGGSAMDVAKCIKFYANADIPDDSVLTEVDVNGIPLIAMPTTAGSGSEATRYAIIYCKGEKQTVTHESIIPSAVIMDASVLETLPKYQKSSTMADALCHAIESFWAVDSTEESRESAREAILQILKYKDLYFANDPKGNEKMLWAAYTAGRAINVTRTTAGHAMCYKLTSLYGLAHGHAAALCVSKLWQYMLDNIDKCSDPRGEQYLRKTFDELAECFGGKSAEQGAEKFQEILTSLELYVPVPNENHFAVMIPSVNPARLKNNPIELDSKAIEKIYRSIFE